MKIRIKKSLLMQVVRQILCQGFDKNSLQIEQIPKRLKRQIKQITDNIGDVMIRQQLPDDYHITVVYGSDADPQDIKQIFEDPIQVSNQDHISYFDNEQQTVAVVKIQKTADFRKLVKSIQKHYGGNETYDSWQPHITVAYLKPDCRLPDIQIKKHTWIVNNLIFSSKTGKKIDVTNRQKTD